ncbi:MAG: dynamin family protein [Eubacteriales bacterium]
MKCTKFIDSVLDVFRKRPSTFKRYEYEVEWLEQRKVKWSNNKIRIGVIGVTSSGKSTLINAILGDQLLSMAVKPSSSQLVSCSKGDESKAIICFKNSQDITLQGKQLNLENIKKYSDENENRHNKKNVSDIQLITPSFDLGDDVVLIDSAGLDAYKLENHEKLSLEVLLPTIDMCIFVTTLKTNSDEKTRTVLNAIAKHKCPLVIVQNMLDSVEPSADGKKTKEMVAQEHKKRLQRVIDASTIEEKLSVSIIQLSAIYAMKARCQNIKEEKDSHYKEFKLLMNDMIKTFVPKIDGERCNSAFSRYRQMISDEGVKTSGVMIAPAKFKYEGIKESLHRNFETTNNELLKEISNLTLKNISGSNDLTKDNVDYKIDNLKSIVKKCEENILIIISAFNKKLSDSARILDIPLRDLVKFERLETISGPQRIIESKTQYKKEKKSGFSAGFARVVGLLLDDDDLGYEQIPYTIKELDKTRTTEELKKYIERAHRVYKQVIDGWLRGLQAPISNIDVEIDRSYLSFIERQKKIEEAEDVLWVIGQLKKIFLTFSTDEKIINCTTVSTPIVKEDSLKLSQVTLSGYQMGLLTISRMVLHKAAQQSLKHCLLATQAPKKAVVMGWDIECIQNFVLRFIGVLFSEESYSTLEKSGKVLIEDNLCILCPDDKHLKQLQKVDTPTTFYIMVNAQQDGLAKNQISKLLLKDNIKTKDKIFFVVQDFDSLIASDGVMEMKSNLLEYYDEFEIIGQKGIVLINDDNPIYNIAFEQSQLELCNNIGDEQELLKQLQKKFYFLFDSKVSNVVGDLIRNERNAAR